MNSLRVRLALLLVIAIVAVVAVLTAITLFAFGPRRPAHTIEPISQQIMMLVTAIESGGTGLSLSPTKPMLSEDKETTEWLRSVLRNSGFDREIAVLQDASHASKVIAIPLEGRGWLSVPMPDLPPRTGAWSFLTRWMLLITCGAAVVAVLAANRMIRPLIVLEDAIANVGPDAVLPNLPETGPTEVRVTAQALNRLSSRLKSAMESRMRLVAAAGHDLRTPITRMRLRAEFLKSEERADWLKDLDELERIADSAILLVREEVSNTVAEPLRLDHIVCELADDLRKQGHNVTVEHCMSVDVMASKLSVARALRNLIINASTHGGGAHIRVDASNKEAITQIDDEGPGIPEELLNRVFEPFFRVDPARRQSAPGAGLGLSIARELIERNGGRIHIENKLPNGLRQTVSFPLI